MPYSRFIQFSIVVVLSLLSHRVALSAETYLTETLAVENRSPVIQLYALTRPEYFLGRDSGSYQWESRLNLSNYLSTGSRGKHYLFIDGETWTMDNTLRHQLSSQAMVHVTLPWLHHGSGFTDRSIYHFHELFQLPQNGRTSSHHDLMNWVVRAEGQDIIVMDESISGLGDIKLKLTWMPGTDTRTQINLQLKLPTGDFDKQTGSEKADIGASIIAVNPDWLIQRDWLQNTALSFWYGAGFSLLGQPRQLDDLEPNRWSLTARAGAGWQISPEWQLKMQFDSNSALFDSAIRELGWIPVQIGFATEHNISPDIRLDFMMIEDLRPRVTPDIIFSTGLNVHF